MQAAKYADVAAKFRKSMKAPNPAAEITMKSSFHCNKNKLFNQLTYKVIFSQTLPANIHHTVVKQVELYYLEQQQHRKLTSAN